MYHGIFCATSGAEVFISALYCRDGKEVVSTLKVKITTKDDTSILKISGITQKQSGQYKCVAVNSVGKAEHTATVNVTGRSEML